MIVIQEDKERFSTFATADDKFIVAMGETFDDFGNNLLAVINFSFEDNGLHYSLAEIKLISCQEAGVSFRQAYKGFRNTKA